MAWALSRDAVVVAVASLLKLIEWLSSWNDNFALEKLSLCSQGFEYKVFKPFSPPVRELKDTSVVDHDHICLTWHKSFHGIELPKLTFTVTRTRIDLCYWWSGKSETTFGWFGVASINFISWTSVHWSNYVCVADHWDIFSVIQFYGQLLSKSRRQTSSKD